MSEALIGLIGGSGLGDALVESLQDTETHELDTPFGRPSGPIVVGTLAQRRVSRIPPRIEARPHSHHPDHGFCPFWSFSLSFPLPGRFGRWRIPEK